MPLDAALTRPHVASAEEAEGLVKGVIDVMAALESLMHEETLLMKGGRIDDALAREARKSELAGTYLRALERLKSNAIALARLAPAALDELKASHRRFSRVIETNQTVLATARAVSEGLMRSLADEVGKKTRPQAYAANRQMAPHVVAQAAPLVVSKKL